MANFAPKAKLLPLIRSISGVRGTIGGRSNEGLTPPEIVRTVSAFASMLSEVTDEASEKRIVIGRDARVSGPMVRDVVIGTLRACGFEVVDLGLTSTPTVELMVPLEKASGGIVLTASHNPPEWNALKFLDGNGEFISAQMGEELIRKAEGSEFDFVPYDRLGDLQERDGNEEHIRRVLGLEWVDPNLIKERGFRIVLDAVNSSGGVILPPLLEALGVEDLIQIHCEPTGKFAHNPEPLPQHLQDLSERVVSEKADLGIVVDPDVDRLAFVDENGAVFGEEYTLVAVADYLLSKRKGDTVSNLSSSRALKDVTEMHGGQHHASAVGEVNVVAKMKEVKALIGGEGNGGVILPELHYGRDALVGIALFLTHLAGEGVSCSDLRARYPDYYMAKEKLELSDPKDVEKVLDAMKEAFEGQPMNLEDGVKIEFDQEWVHLRRSNTEPIVRIYTESKTREGAEELAHNIVRKARTVLEESGPIES